METGTMSLGVKNRHVAPGGVLILRGIFTGIQAGMARVRRSRDHHVCRRTQLATRPRALTGKTKLTAGGNGVHPGILDKRFTLVGEPPKTNTDSGYIFRCNISRNPSARKRRRDTQYQSAVSRTRMRCPSSGYGRSIESNVATQVSPSIASHVALLFDRSKYRHCTTSCASLAHHVWCCPISRNSVSNAGRVPASSCVKRIIWTAVTVQNKSGPTRARRTCLMRITYGAGPVSH